MEAVMWKNTVLMRSRVRHGLGFLLRASTVLGRLWYSLHTFLGSFTSKTHFSQPGCCAHTWTGRKVCGLAPWWALCTLWCLNPGLQPVDPRSMRRFPYGNQKEGCGCGPPPPDSDGCSLVLMWARGSKEACNEQTTPPNTYPTPPNLTLTERDAVYRLLPGRYPQLFCTWPCFPMETCFLLCYSFLLQCKHLVIIRHLKIFIFI